MACMLSIDTLLPACLPAWSTDGQPSKFMDDALRLERVLADYAPSWLV
jgi:hypothetical protein